MNVTRALVWLLAAAVTGAALWTVHGPGVTAGGLAVGAGLIVLGLRRKAPVEPGALHSASADLVEGRKQRPGQLSVTKTEVVWKPSSYSRRHGLTEIRVPVGTGTKVTMRQGRAALDALVTVTHDGEARVFLTRVSRRLTRAIRALPETRPHGIGADTDP